LQDDSNQHQEGPEEESSSTSKLVTSHGAEWESHKLSYILNGIQPEVVSLKFVFE
jgi:hypothetical protein